MAEHSFFGRIYLDPLYCLDLMYSVNFRTLGSVLIEEGVNIDVRTSPPRDVQRLRATYA